MKHLLKCHDTTERRWCIDLQNEAVLHLKPHTPHLDLPEPILSRNDTYTEEFSARGIKTHGRLLKFVEGRLLSDVVKISGFLSSAGAVAGALDVGLQDFEHPGAARPELAWDLRNAMKAVRYLPIIADPAVRRIADYFLLQYEVETAPVLETLALSVTHNDCHRAALLSRNLEKNTVTGVIDFGDTVLSHPVCHLAIAISDLIVGESDPLAAASHVVAGYHGARALTAAETDILYFLVGARLSIYLCMAAKAAAEDPENQHAQAKKLVVEIMARIWLSINPIEAREQFRRVCGVTSLKRELGPVQKHAQAVRRRHFPNSVYTHYREPLHLVRGAFQYLYGADGRTYIDLVNNVCQLGHCHPVIVRAVRRQVAQLNTNSRYIYNQMSDLAERLVASMPNGLDTVFLVNSGSEANDLALRLAQAFTGNREIIVIDTAYHGNSSVCTEISPQRVCGQGRAGLPEHVRMVSAPDLYRGPYGRSDPEAGAKYAKEVDAVVQGLAAVGRRPSAFIAESLIGTGGQIVLPEGYLKAAYAYVRSGGGVCIADEVQVGFGRTGAHMWCFESQGVTPDIVTLGKPIANGVPMGAVVTRREIAEAFDRGAAYFNTFGGNPVSCAAAIAVIDLLKDESLMAETESRGRWFRGGLEAIMRGHPLLGDVRGQGLYLGAELVSDPEAKTPASDAAQRVVEEMKARGFLINTNGRAGNVLKFKPPLVISQDDIDLALTALDECLRVAG